ncbi:MAG TPA: TonB-dependent receptor [Chitinophagaceae bacterium]|nr:TonB-dependent receptor [Chitinophagaceae bacterium]
MKLTLILTVFCVFHSFAGIRGQTVTLTARDTRISTVLSDIEKQGNVRFLFNSRLKDLHQKVTVSFNNTEIGKALDELFTGTSLRFRKFENNLIVIRSESGEDHQVQVTGHVTSETGAPLSGVSVLVRGTNRGTVTNADGNFILNIDDPNAVLVFSYIGYETQEVPLGGRTQVSVAMTLSQKQLDQVIVVGYGTQRKLDVTGSVAQVKGDEVAKQPASNAISSLQGKVAGVQITNSGAPGASPEIRIRGLGTIYGSQSPLYVVDGVWYDDISFLNPADIDNISILKDASSESIFGVRAANGVILISTKKGKSGAAVVNYNGYVGYQNVTNQIKMADGSQYATLINELRGNTDLNPADFGKGTDWYHQVLRNALVTNHQVSVSGGTERSTYNFSLGYFKQDGIVETNSYSRYTARLQNDFQVFKPLKLGYTLTAVASNSRDIDGSIFHQLFAAAPIVPVRYADGSYGDPSDYNLGDGANFNPQVTIDFFNQRSKNYRATGNAYADLKMARHFTFHSSIGGDFGQAEVRNYLPVYTATLKQRNTLSALTISRAETRNWILENTFTYENRFNDHSLKVLVGQSANQNQIYGLTGSAKGVPYSSSGDLYLSLGNTGTATVTDYGDLSHWASYFGRVNYSFKNRYLLNASFRADGSSKFSGNKRWGYFPSVGAGWVISDEDFMKSQRTISYLKLRGSWGQIGNASVPSNLPTQLVDNNQGYSVAWGNGAIGTGASIDQLVPPVLYWEKGVGTDIGLEGSLLKSRLSFDADFYNRKTQDAIFDIPILSSIGTSSGAIIGNQATIQNQGFELLLTWKDDISKDFSYRVSGNIGINENKVLKTVTGENPIYGGGSAATGGQLATRTIVGQPIGQYYGLQVTGIFQNATEVANSAQAATAKPGDFKYVDQNKDGVIDGKDRIALGNPNAKFTYGLNTNWTYRQFDLTLDFQGVAGVQIYNANLGIRYGTENFTKDFYDNRWHGEGTSNSYPSVNIGGGDNYKPNSFFVENGSYFRVRNAQLGYTFSKAIADRLRARQLRVYVNAQNALNFFRYRGFSPEIGGSALSRGIDTNVYPLYATYNFGVNLSF